MFKRNDQTTIPPTVQTVERITSVLGAGIIWQGSISGSGGVRIEGMFEGQIALKGLLVVGETGKVTCENCARRQCDRGRGSQGQYHRPEGRDPLHRTRLGRYRHHRLCHRGRRLPARPDPHGRCRRSRPGRSRLRHSDQTGKANRKADLSKSNPPKVPMSYPDLADSDRQGVQAALRQAGLPEDDLQSVLKVLDGPNLSMGPQIAAFEKFFCDYTGARHAIGVNSGTAGLHLCVRAAGIQAGDLVLTTPFSFVASTNVHPVRECHPGLCGCGSAYRQSRYPQPDRSRA